MGYDNNKNIDKIIVITVVLMLVVGPFEKRHLKASVEQVYSSIDCQLVQAVRSRTRRYTSLCSAC